MLTFWKIEAGRSDLSLSWDGQSVKSRTARYVAQGTPVKVKTVIDTYKNRLWILTFMATLDFYMFCSVQNNRSFFVDRSREINVFRHAPFAHNHKLYKRILTIFDELQISFRQMFCHTDIYLISHERSASLKTDRIAECDHWKSWEYFSKHILHCLDKIIHSVAITTHFSWLKL